MNIQRKFQLIMIVLGMALVMPGVALAAHYAISTTDDSVSDWAGVPTTLTDGDDVGVDDNWDIDQAWVANNSDHSEMYFRVSLVGTGVFPTDNPYNKYIEASLDCNNDHDVTDSVDVVISYDVAQDYSVECPGNDMPSCLVTLEDNPTSFAQTILGTPNNYEFKADVAGIVDWSACTDDILVTFDTYDFTTTGTIDYTSEIEMDIPTVVTMGKISAHSKNESQAALVLIIVGALLIAGQSIFRRKKI